MSGERGCVMGWDGAGGVVGEKVWWERRCGGRESVVREGCGEKGDVVREKVWWETRCGG